MSSRWVSRVVAGTGPRGSGKTLWLTVVQVIALIKAYYLGFNVWSNYPVGFWYRDPLTNRRVYLCSEALNMSMLYTFSKGLAWGWVFIDEIDKWLDRQEWNAATAQIIVQVLTMIRKRQLSLGMTIQDLNWLNARGQFQTDVEINNRDAAFSPWGKSVGLQHGEVVNQLYKDLNGTYTGYTYDETGKIYHADMRAKWAWPLYDTDNEYNPMAEKVQLNRKKREMEFDPATGQLIDITAQKNQEMERFNQDLFALADIIKTLKSSGVEVINKSELRGIALERKVNLALSASDFSRALSRFNVDTSSRVNFNIAYANEMCALPKKFQQSIQQAHPINNPLSNQENNKKELVTV